MAKYIKGEAAVAVFEERQKALCPVGEWGRNKAYDREKFDALEEILDELRAIPAADVAPLRHGRWVLVNKAYDKYKCSNCGALDYITIGQKYCIYCGAKMDGETEGSDG